MDSVKIEAQLRDISTQGKLNSLRTSGWIPAILYGSQTKAKTKNSKSDGVYLKVNEKAFLKTIGNRQKSTMLVELDYGENKANAVIKELQHDVVTRKLIHIDFQRVSMTEKIEVMVPIHTEGEAPGVKLSGGILEHITREVKIVCLPKDIPPFISVDISQLQIGQGLHIKDLKAIPNIEVISDANLLVVNIVAAKVEEVAAPATPTTAAEPEVIAKGKKPEEGAEGAAAAAPAKGQEKAAAPAKDKAAPAQK